jgi:hypothetical protein
VIVTDFIGSGTRVTTFLDRFWRVTSVRAWWSRGWVKFGVVACAGTRAGIAAVELHPAKPRCMAEHIVPTVEGQAYPNHVRSWRHLIANYGPPESRGPAGFGYKGTGALLAFSYGIPNNAPMILHSGGGGWKPLFSGPAPEEAREAFGLPRERRLGVRPAANADLREAEAAAVVVLGSLRGRWRDGKEVELAERTGLTSPEVFSIRSKAEQNGWLDNNGRLTDSGQKLLQAAGKFPRKRPIVPTSDKPYYPTSLRVPRK